MTETIFRSVQKPIRGKLSWEERWKGPDKGLIISWEVGRKLSRKEPELAERAKKGELPVLNWKGGTEKPTQKNEKYGSLYYLAQWQGLRCEDLDIDVSKKTELICTKTGMRVIYAKDIIRSVKPDLEDHVA
ncbi:MAG: hypothetical protein HQ556_13485 [Candidatus Marinimicrobia bacterium]|nr:hypothetical protein [Candidatus Neomarinimicrobiota bacterium]